MTTELLFRSDAYQTTAQSQVIAITEQGGIILDRTLFYPTGGGQPGDKGVLQLNNGQEIAITTTVWEDAAHTRVVHVPVENSELPKVGETVEMQLDWATRYSHMRVHTALHLLSVVLPYAVTGGSISAGEGRLDFDIPDSILDKEQITAQLQALIDQDLPVSESWITDAELDANPELVKTMSVQPPRGSGQIRLIHVQGVDLQPCGGTHLKRTSEIGQVTITKIEKKGKLNRRVRMVLV
ncbi:alanyl-tRNA editing protein [uncultured Thiothrix sp.]|uniref:alanyl-tRNA editing protein n=1 Tax=uncultured Thiothrix sp. TaxID=223185 RepID=UPI0026214C1E|nr:alanyl-tRNA editing protein [uncultured Thiothrix sp.]